MRTEFHGLINLISGLVLFLLFPSQISLLGFGIIFISGIILDLDHLIYYKFNLKKLIKDFKENIPHMYIFHTLEFILILVILSLFFQIAFFILIGVCLHILTDIIVDWKYIRGKFFKYYSIIYNWIRN